MDTAQEYYREAGRLYRMLFWEMPWQVKQTFLGLTRHLRLTGDWPNMEYLTEWSQFSQQTTLRHLQFLERSGFLCLADRKTKFPVARMTEVQVDVFWALIQACLATGKAQVTVQEVVNVLLEDVGVFTERETLRCLRTLRKRKLLRIRMEKTPKGKEAMHQLLPSADLAKCLAAMEWHRKQQGRFFARMDAKLA